MSTVKTTNNKRALALGAVAAALVACLSIGGAMSYFTSYVQARGGQPIELGTTTTIHETFRDWTKTVSISNAEDGHQCYVRVKTFSGSQHELTYDGGSSWYYGDSLGNTPYMGTDGWWYCNELLLPGQSTPELKIAIKNVNENDTTDFNVVVVHESTIISNPQGTGGDWSSVASSNAS